MSIVDFFHPHILILSHSLLRGEEIRWGEKNKVIGKLQRSDPGLMYVGGV